MKDGLINNEEWTNNEIVNTGSFIGSILANTANTTSRFCNLIMTGSIAVAGTISGAGAYIGTSFSDDGKTLSPVGAGSPTNTWGKTIQCGSNTTGAGSNTWVVFPTAFGGIPSAVFVDANKTAGATAFAQPGSWHAGSFYVESSAASEIFSWMAVGT